MTTSVSPSDESLCQTSRAEWPSRRTAWTASWSQLLAGNCNTAKFIFFFATESPRHREKSGLCASASRWLINNFQFVILNHRIAQQLVRGVIQGFMRGGLVGAGREVNLDVFADVDAGDAGVAHVGEGGLDGLALRVQDGLFGGDDDFCFHARGLILRKEFCG